MPENATAPRTRVLRIGLPLAAAGLLAAACGSSGGGSGAAASAPPATTSSTASSAPAPASSAGSSAAAAGTAVKLTDGHLTDATGRTLYLWVADSGTTSTCSGSCAAVWPPVPASGTPTVGTGLTASRFTDVKRADGSTQLDYAGHPLYYFEADTAAGDTKGQGSDSFGAKWWELDASGNAITTAATSGSGSSSTASSSASTGGGGYGY